MSNEERCERFKKAVDFLSILEMYPQAVENIDVIVGFFADAMTMLTIENAKYPDQALSFEDLVSAARKELSLE